MGRSDDYTRRKIGIEESFEPRLFIYSIARDLHRYEKVQMKYKLSLVMPSL